MNRSAARALNALAEAGLPSNLVDRILGASIKSTRDVFGWDFIPKDVLARAKRIDKEVAAAEKFGSTQVKADNSTASFIQALKLMGVLPAQKTKKELDIVARARAIDREHGGTISRQGEVPIAALYQAARDVLGTHASALDAAYRYTTGRTSAQDNVVLGAQPQPGGAVSPAQPQASQAGPVPAAAPSDPVGVALASGNVKALQTALNAAGAKLVVDGKRGAKTNAALAAYQGQHPEVAAAPVARAPRAAVGGAGGGGGGTVVAPPAGPPRPPPLNETELRNYVLSNYGYGQVLFDDPEMHKILADAANQRLSPEEVQARVMGTSFWKRTSASARAWQQKADQDPAQAARLVEQKKLDVRLEASRLGFAVPDDRLTQIATDSLKLGFSDAELRGAIAHEMHYSPGQQVQGDIGSSMTQVKQLSRDFFTDLSDQKVFELAQKMYTGEMDDQGVRQFFVNQAKNLFSANDQLVKLIDSGISPGTYFEPTRNDIANLLEINPDDIDFVHDPKWLRVIDSVDPKGNRRPMTRWEAQDYARSQPEWMKTRQANEQAAALANKLLQTFGAVA